MNQLNPYQPPEPQTVSDPPSFRAGSAVLVLLLLIAPFSGVFGFAIGMVFAVFFVIVFPAANAIPIALMLFPTVTGIAVTFWVARRGLATINCTRRRSIQRRRDLEDVLHQKRHDLKSSVDD